MGTFHFKSTLHGNKLVSTVTVPKNLQKYFNCFQLYAKYDAPIKAGKSILSIPLISNVLPLAWLTGSDVHVESLDKNYVVAMDSIKKEFNAIFPCGRFKTKIIVDDLVDNQTGSDDTAVLFTGGIDSTHSLIANIALKPRLIMYSGIQHYQLYPSYEKREHFVKKRYAEFAKQQGLELNYIKTNIIGVLNDNRITHDFHKILRGTLLWLALQQPLVLLSLPAPLSIGRFNRLIISATVDANHDFMSVPCSSQPRIDEKFAWADLTVKHHGNINRLNKTKLITDYSKNNKIEINVCNYPPTDRFNCSNCEKCYRTIAALILEGEDPNKLGFVVTDKTFLSMKQLLIRKKADALALELIWKELQNQIPDKIDTNLYGSTDFFMWFKKVDFEIVRKKRDLYWVAYNSLPYPAALFSDALIYSARNSLFKKNIRVIDPLMSFISLLRFSLGGSKKTNYGQELKAI